MVAVRGPNDPECSFKSDVFIVSLKTKLNKGPDSRLDVPAHLWLWFISTIIHQAFMKQSDYNASKT